MPLRDLLDELQARLSEIRDDLAILRQDFHKSEVETTKEIALLQQSVNELINAVKGVRAETEEKKKSSVAVRVCVIGSLTSILTTLIALLKK